MAVGSGQWAVIFYSENCSLITAHCQLFYAVPPRLATACDADFRERELAASFCRADCAEWLFCIQSAVFTCHSCYFQYNADGFRQ